MAEVARPTDRPPWAWRFVLRLAVWVLRRVLGWRVRARPPAVVPPPDQPLVVVLNHTSNVDAFLVAHTVWRRLGHWCQPLAKAELFEVPVLGTLARGAGAIPVSRGEGTGREAAYEDAVARLREGGTLLIAPEGTITHDGSLLPLRHGAARLALEARVPVLVVTHFGAQRGFSPVVRLAERGVVVTMAVDVLSPWPDDDAASLTGRIAATMMDRSAELQAAYPQADPGARWWPPYAAPASPTTTARENLERYRESMVEGVAHARERMARFAEEHAVEQRVLHARERAQAAAGDLAVRSRERAEQLGDRARHRLDDIGDRARARAADHGLVAPRQATAGPRPDEDGSDEHGPHEHAADAAAGPRPDEHVAGPPAGPEVD